MAIMGWIFLLRSDLLAQFWGHLMFRDTSRLPKEERPEAEAEAIVAGLILLVAVLFGLIAWSLVSS